MSIVVVSGSFDDIRSRQVRLLEEASKLGALRVLLWSDAAVRRVEGRPPKFPEAERRYLVESIRHVREVSLVDEGVSLDSLPVVRGPRPDVAVFGEAGDSEAKRRCCKAMGVEYRILRDADLRGFPVPPPGERETGRKRVVVTGCFDWFHSGHVRFFEEVSELGDLFVVVGHDANIRLLKGEGHPLFPETERRYLVGAVRFVKESLVSSGGGWLDAEPEIAAIRPHIYAVNQDGDRPEKREFCERAGIEYVVLERQPKEGLPRRQSTDLRGF